MDTITEAERETPIWSSVDVLVAGGGIAGVAAAVAAARAGRSVYIVEKTCALGGLATLGNVTVWLPLCDGCGRQVTAGLAEELLQLSVAELQADDDAAGFSRVPACWRAGGDRQQRGQQRYSARFNPTAYLLALEHFVAEAGVQVLYDTRICAVHRSADRITHVLVESKSGRHAIACSAAVDATGDADLCFQAGEETQSLDTNVLSGWFYYRDIAGIHLDYLSCDFSPVATREGAEGPFFRGDNVEQVTAQLMGTRQLIRDHLARLRALPGCESTEPILVPTVPCFRMTRRLVGAVSLSDGDVHTWFDDTIGLLGDWRSAGPVYAIPFRALQGVASRNLLVAGRCISADTTAWDVTRALPGCALTGEAAGTAAALAVADTDGDVAALSTEVLQAYLRKHGVLLDPHLVEPARRVS